MRTRFTWWMQAALGTSQMTRLSDYVKCRNEIARRKDLIDLDAWSFLWVVDAPLFEPASDSMATTKLVKVPADISCRVSGRVAM